MDTLQRRALEKQKKLEEQQRVETLESYQLVLEYLLDEGFASTEQAADKIILNMSEVWFEDIMEGKGHPGYKAGSKDHGPMQAGHPADGPKRSAKGGTMSMRHGYHLGDMDDEDEDEDELESIVKQQSRDSRERTRKPLRDKVKATKKKITKEDLDQLDENRRAARSAGGYKDDSKEQPDPSEEGFTGIGKMSIKDIMALNKKIEAKKKIKEELVSEEDFSEGVRDSEVEEKGKKVGEYERAGKYKGITDKFRKEHPGSREQKKERGAKKSEGGRAADQRAFSNKLQSKYGRTKKQQREAEIMSKHTSPRD
jgi:hypothetical protein